MSKYCCLIEMLRQSSLVQIPPRYPERARGELWVQLELALPGGMKDRAALRIIEDAERSGRLRPGGIIAESSSGSMAEGIARVGRLKGYRVIVVTDPRIDELTRSKLVALGAELEVVEEYDPVGGWQSSRLRRLRQVLDENPEAVWACQYDTPSNAAAYHGVGEHIHQQLGDGVAALVATVGSGGSMSGTAASLRRLCPEIRVVAVDAVGSVLFHQPDRKRLQTGHGNSIVPGNVRHELIDEVHWLSDAEVFNACRELARNTGIFAGGSSGAAYVVASWLAEQVEPGQKVVAIFPDRGDRYHRRIYSDGYFEEHKLNGTQAPAEPRSIRYGVDEAERWSRAELPHGGAVPYFAPGVRRTCEIARELGLVGG